MGALIPNQKEPAAAAHYFEFRNVCKSFGDHVVLDDVSFYVDRGETCVIMGRSGVGKSAALKLLLGFLSADSGRILVDGGFMDSWWNQVGVLDPKTGKVQRLAVPYSGDVGAAGWTPDGRILAPGQRLQAGLWRYRKETK